MFLYSHSGNENRRFQFKFAVQTKNICAMRKNLYTFLFILLMAVNPVTLNAQGGPPWIKYNVGYNYILRGIDFPSNQNNIGYTAGQSLTYNGNGIVLKTTDAGTTWNPVWTGTQKGIEGSCFVDLNNGFIAGWPKTSDGWSGFGKTTDGGATWTSPSVGSDIYYFTDVVFKDPNNGILVGSTNTVGRVWVTSNGGSTWTIATGITNPPQHACHVSGNTHYLTDNGGNIKKSTNNGQSWTVVHTIPGVYMLGVDFFTDNIGMACGDYGVISTTYDGGVTWFDQQVGTDIWHGLAWQSEDHLFVCGTPELVYESTDGGENWVNGFPATTYSNALYECIFTANGTGFICGSQGTLLKRLPSCAAAFTANKTSVCAGGTVSFSSQSTGSNLTYEWTFEGGTPASSTLPNPTVTYSAAGSWDVKLVVHSGSYSDQLLRNDYINSSDKPSPPVITANGYTLMSNTATGNQWYRNGVAIFNATGQTYTATQSGNYWDVVIQNGCASDTSNNIYLLFTGINDAKPALEFTLSPVPNEGVFTLSGTSADEKSMSIQVFNQLGQQVYSQSDLRFNGSFAQKIDLRPTSPGVYTVVVSSGENRSLKKLIINK